MGADTKSKHYEITFEEHSGRVIRAIFTYTARLGVMKTSDRILRDPTHAEQAGAPQPATAPESRLENKEKPKPESDKRSQ